MSASEYFNPIPLFILFREAIEASIVVSVLLTFVARSSVPGLKAQSECAVRRFPANPFRLTITIPITRNRDVTVCDVNLDLPCLLQSGGAWGWAWPSASR